MDHNLWSLSKDGRDKDSLRVIDPLLFLRLLIDPYFDTLNEGENLNKEVQKRERALTTVSMRLAQPDFKIPKKNNEEEKMPEESKEEKTAAGKPKAIGNRHPCLRFKMESIEGRDSRTVRHGPYLEYEP